MATPISAALSQLSIQVRRRTDRAIREVGRQYLAHVKLVIRNNPGSLAEGVLHRPDVLLALDTALREQHQVIQDLLSASYQAAMRLARTGLQGQYADLGYSAPAVELWPSGYLDAVLADVDRAFDQAKTDILHLAGEAYRGVSAPQSYRQQRGGVVNVGVELGRLRAVAVAAAVQKALQRLALSARSATSVITSRGYNEISADSYVAFQQEHPTLRLGKQWQTTSVDPCDMCRALNGSVVTLSMQFSHTATEGRLIPVFRDLQSPPRHPNCQCELNIIVLEPGMPLLTAV